MCAEYKDLQKKVQTLEDTVADLEDQLSCVTCETTNEDFNTICESLDKYRECLEGAKAKLVEFDYWCLNHISITKKETKADWYKGTEDQFKLDV